MAFSRASSRSMPAIIATNAIARRILSASRRDRVLDPGAARARSRGGDFRRRAGRAAGADRMIALDRVIGFAMVVVMLPMLLAAEWIARKTGGGTAWSVFAIFVRRMGVSAGRARLGGPPPGVGR